VRHAQLAGHTIILGAQAGLLPYGDPELFVPFLEDKSTGLCLEPLLPPPQTYNGVYPIYNAEPSSGQAQRNDNKDSDQGIIHGNTGLPFPTVSDNGQPTTTIRASTSATFNQDRIELLNHHYRLGHVSIKRARLLNIDGIPQPPSKMPKVKCPVCIAAKATRHKRPSATTADTRSASGPWQDIYSDLSGKMRISSICVSMLRRVCMHMVRCQTLRIYCTQESLHRRISSIPGNYRHQATIHLHASNRSRRRIHQPSDASSLQQTSNEPCRLWQRRTLFSRSS